MADFSAKHYMIKSEKNAVRAGEEADRAESYANSLQPETFVKTNGNQTIGGTKTFTNAPKIVNTSAQNMQILLSDITANSEIGLMQATSNGKNQFLIRFDNGNKYPFVISQDPSDNTKFSFTITSAPAATSNTTEIATTAWVNTRITAVTGGAWTPNYGSVTSITASGYTAPSNGWGVATISSNWGTASNLGFVYVNGVMVANNTHTEGSAGKGHTNTFIFPVKKGNKITYTSLVTNVRFIAVG